MEQIKIGILVNTHGLQGEVKVKFTTDFPQQRFEKGNTILLEEKNGLKELVVERVRFNKGLLIVKFVGYDNINDVEAWKGSALRIAKEDIHELEEDEAYYFELKDCSVEDMSGTYLGNVSEVIETNANAVLRVKNDEQEFLVPYVKAFVKDFKKDEKKIIIELMEGLL